MIFLYGSLTNLGSHLQLRSPHLLKGEPGESLRERQAPSLSVGTGDIWGRGEGDGGPVWRLEPGAEPMDGLCGQALC